jgi:UDP-N-acetylmuramoyl-tripeptide--D-alanyl-D-alanine ligase
MGEGRRRFAVIAALRELGEDGPALNEDLGRLAAAAGLEAVVVVGEDAGPVLRGAPGAIHVPDASAAARELSGRLAPGDVVLVKGPRAAGLERVAEAILGGDAR